MDGSGKEADCWRERSCIGVCGRTQVWCRREPRDPLAARGRFCGQEEPARAGVGICAGGLPALTHAAAVAGVDCGVIESWPGAAAMHVTAAERAIRCIDPGRKNYLFA